MAVSASERVVIVGAGQSGHQVAASLREEGWSGAVMLVGDERHPPYQRPPLSKSYLLGDAGPEALCLAPPDFYRDRRIDRIEGCPIVSIDRESRRIEAADGRTFSYSSLVLATGASNRVLNPDGPAPANVLSVRGLDDVGALRLQMGRTKRVVVIGGGFLGLEFASVAAAAGKAVTVIEAAPTLLPRALRPQLAQALLTRHLAAGIGIRLGAWVDRIEEGDGIATCVQLADGEWIGCDLVVVSIGVVPNDRLASEAGLTVDDGVLVNEFLQTSDPAIYAVGDCARFRTTGPHESLRLESVQNAVDQAKYLARRIARRVNEPYRDIPWFWSEQGSVRIHIAGVTGRSNQAVIRQDADNERLSALCFRDGLFIGVESLNAFADYKAGRTILEKGCRLEIERVQAPGFDLKAFAASL